jgi:hypothetical protein
MDAGSGQALAGATVRLDVSVACRSGGGFQREPQPRRYVETDAEGRFEIVGDEVQAPCWRPELWGELRVAAPGYLAAGERDVFEKPGPEVSAGVLPLHRAGGRPGFPAGAGRFAPHDDRASLRLEGRGAGIKRGYVHGKSDKTGSSPAEDPVHPTELLARLSPQARRLAERALVNAQLAETRAEAEQARRAAAELRTSIEALRREAAQPVAQSR